MGVASSVDISAGASSLVGSHVGVASFVDTSVGASSLMGSSVGSSWVSTGIGAWVHSSGDLSQGVAPSRMASLE